MSLPLPVGGEADIGHVRREVQRIATEIGFDTAMVAELAIVATELATNLVKHHSADGKVMVSVLGPDGGEGIEIVSADRGPGIRDVPAALADHHSTKGTRGCGLGAVRRLMDEFHIHSQVGSESPNDRHIPPAGTVITTRKWVGAPRIARHLVYSVSSLPHPGETANGDAFLVHEDEHGVLLAVADGLGHGPNAAKASQRAIAYVRDRTGRDLGQLFVELHETLHNTRGVALTLVRLCVPEGILVHAGIGNVEARLYSGEPSILLTRPGVLGTGPAPRPRVNQIPWPTGATLIVHSDGISKKWDFNETPGVLECHVSTVCHYLMRDYARSNDDATIVVARTLA